VILFVGNLVAKLVLDLIGVAAGGSTSAVGKSLLLTFGLTMLSEAFVVWMRTGGTTGILNPLGATTPQPRRPSTERFVDATQPLELFTRYRTGDQANLPAPSREAVAPEAEPVGWPPKLHDGADWLRRQIDQPRKKPASSSTTPVLSFADAIEHRHRRHHHSHSHNHGHRHGRGRP
jgi:hypothetical protein